MQNDLLTEARATEIAKEVSGFMGLPVNIIRSNSNEIRKAIKAGFTEACYEIALLRAIVRAAAHCGEDPYLAIAQQLYLAKNNPTERVSFIVTSKDVK